MADTKKKKSTKVIEIPVIPFDEQNTEDAAGQSTNRTKRKAVPRHGTTGTYTPYKD